MSAAVVVVGGAGVIGSAVIQRLRREGSRTIAWDISIAREDPDAVWCDVRDEESIDAAMTRTLAAVGVPSRLVNCAALASRQVPATEAADSADWTGVLGAKADYDQLMAVNVVGAASCMRRFVRTRLESGATGGAIVNVSSISGHSVAEAGTGPYSVSKAGLEALTRVAAVELGAFGITVNAVAAGFMVTAMPSAGISASRAVRSDPRPHTPLNHRLGRDHDIAESVCAVLACQWMTGQVITVDGGVTLTGPRLTTVAPASDPD